MIMTIILTSSIEWMIKVKLVMGLQVVVDDYPFLHTNGVARDNMAGRQRRKIYPYNVGKIEGRN